MKEPCQIGGYEVQKVFTKKIKSTKIWASTFNSLNLQQFQGSMRIPMFDIGILFFFTLQ